MRDEQIAGLQDANDVVQPAGSDREARVAAVQHLLEQFFVGLVQVNPLNFRSRGHDSVDIAFAQPEHAFNHVLLSGFEHAHLGALFH